jgi:DNA mismatch endonuclease (patch repair protein)
MVDTLSTVQRSERMGRIRSKGSAAELVVRRAAHRLGYRFRLHRKGLPGKPDLVFVKTRKVIFVHGCFWHRHGDSACKLARLPKSRLDFWLPKLDANRARDSANLEKLRAKGWDVLVVWECELRDKGKLDKTLKAFLGK